MKGIFMKSKLKIFVFILLLTANLAGCDDASDTMITDGYISETFLMDNILSIHTAASHGNVIYFSGMGYPPGYQEGDEAELALYYLDMDSKNPEAIKTIYEYEPDSFINSISINPNESINLAVLNYSSGMNPEIIIKQINLDGMEISRTVLSNDDMTDEFIFPHNLMVDDNGRIYLINNDTIYIWNQDGSFFNDIPINGNGAKMSFDRTYENIYLTWNDTLSGSTIAVIDPGPDQLEPVYESGTTLNCYGFNPGLPGDLLLATNLGVYAFDTNNRRYDTVFSWINLDMIVDHSGIFLPLNDGHFVWVANTANGLNIQVIRPLRQGEKILDKETLVLGGLWFFTDNILMAAIVEFNNANPQYRIEIKDYSNGGADMDNGITRLNFDIVNGKGPDIIALSYKIPLNLFARKGVLTDLYPYIDEDKDIERADFQENILKAYETNGQLFGFPVFYQIDTIIAAKSEVGDINGWNLDEFIEYVNGRLPESKVFYNHSKSGVLSLCLQANGEALVDWNMEGSGFRRELFIKMLRFADQFTPDHLYVSDADISRQIQDDEQVQLLDHAILNYVYHPMFSEIFGEPVVYPGYPSDNGNGNLVRSATVLAINENCQHKDVAWQFISSTLTEEFLTRNYMPGPVQFSILKSINEILIEEMMNEPEEGVWRNYDPFPASDIKAVMDLINSADKIRIYDEQIINIVMEEAGYFFGGAKTVEEVADIAENRIGIYVNEMK